MIRNLLALIGFVAVALAGAAGLYAAGWSRIGDEDVRRLAVSTAGLDLSTMAGQDILDRRVNAAINKVCRDDYSSPFGSISDERKCRRDARIGADRQIAAAVDRATRRAHYAREYERQLQGGLAPYDDGDRQAYAPPPPPPAYAPPVYAPTPAYVAPPPVVRSIDTTIVRKPLKPRVKWVRTKHGLVKKTTHRKLVRKTVKTVYVRR